MSKSTTTFHNTPKLRFPEFTESWRTVFLKDIVNIGTGNKDTKDKSANGAYPFFVRSDNVERINSYSYDGVAILTSGDGAGVGKIFHYIDGKFDYHQRVYALTNFKDSADSKYVFQYFSSHFYDRAIRLSAKNSVDSVRMDMIAKMPIPLPSLIEQQKIANFLTAVDDKIDALKTKVVTLRDYKNNVVQAVYTQKVRFTTKNSEHVPWENVMLGEAMSESRLTGSKGDGAKKLTVKLWGKGVYEKNDQESGSVNTQYYKRKAGQFIYSKLDFLNCAFGIIPKELDGYESTVDLPTFDVKDRFDIRFLLERIRQKDFYKKLGDTADGSRKAKRIHPETFLSYTLLMPSYVEQKKIADFFEAIDAKIEQEEWKIKQVEGFRKALLQQMFI
jgi:type I restriction enzyme S subunit